jgi:hypothetical protein
MTDAAPVPHNSAAPAPSAIARFVETVNRRSAHLSSSLSHAMMIGLIALSLTLQHQHPTGRQTPANYDPATAATPLASALSATALAVAPAATPTMAPPMPDVRSRTVTTVRVNVGEQNGEVVAGKSAAGVAALAKPEAVTPPKSAMVPPIKRQSPPAPPPVPSQSQMVAQASTPPPAPRSASTPATAQVPVSGETAPETAMEPTELVGWPETEVSAAFRQCVTILADHNVQFEHANPLRQGSCGTPAPIKLKSIGKTEVSLANPATMNCAVAVAIGNWVDRVLQPAAKEIFSSPVIKLVGTGSYTCRNRNGAADGPISEHAFANAFDVSGFVLADGRTVDVLGGWGRVARDDTAATKVAGKVTPPAKPPLAPESRSALKGPPVVAVAQPVQVASTPAGAAIVDARPENTSDAKFLRRIHGEACSIFGTVLGPEANDAHRNHLHFDLKDRKGRSYCQ